MLYQILNLCQIDKHLFLKKKQCLKLLSTLNNKRIFKGRCSEHYPRILYISPISIFLEAKQYSMGLHGNHSQHTHTQIVDRFSVSANIPSKYGFYHPCNQNISRHSLRQSKSTNLIMSSLCPRKNRCEFSLVL